MPPRRRKALLSVPKLAPSPLPVRGLLNWRSAAHWSLHELPCRYCGHPTHLRDHKGLPSDKVCAEATLTEIAGIVRTYGAQEWL